MSLSKTIDDGPYSDEADGHQSGNPDQCVRIALQMQANSEFTPVNIPVSADYLGAEGLGEAFITYMSSWKGFVG